MGIIAHERKYSVYWVFSPSEPTVPHYVGVTCNLKRRWREIQCRAGIVGKLLDRVIQNDLAITPVFSGVMTQGDALVCEAIWILSALKANPRLLNKRLPSERMKQRIFMETGHEY